MELCMSPTLAEALDGGPTRGARRRRDGRRSSPRPWTRSPHVGWRRGSCPRTRSICTTGAGPSWPSAGVPATVVPRLEVVSQRARQYVSPEEVAGHRATRRSLVYTLGAILRESVSNEATAVSRRCDRTRDGGFPRLALRASARVRLGGRGGRHRRGCRPGERGTSTARVARGTGRRAEGSRGTPARTPPQPGGRGAVGARNGANDGGADRSGRGAGGSGRGAIGGGHGPSGGRGDANGPATRGRGSADHGTNWGSRGSRGDGGGAPGGCSGETDHGGARESAVDAARASAAAARLRRWRSREWRSRRRGSRPRRRRTITVAAARIAVDAARASAAAARVAVAAAGAAGRSLVLAAASAFRGSSAAAPC